MAVQLNLFVEALCNECFSEKMLNILYEEKISLTPVIGADGITQQAFKKNISQNISIIIRKFLNCTYKFTPYRQKLISKGAGKFPRVISIPTIRDRLVLRAANEVLARAFPNARSFRPHTLIKNIRKKLSSVDENTAFVRIDVRDFYPTINHQRLLDKIRRKFPSPHFLHLIGDAISAPTGGKQLATLGIPQGLSISNILSSIYLESFDEKFLEKYDYFRYVDDILVLSKEDQAEVVFDDIRRSLNGLGLKCHKLGKQGKSQISNVQEGVEYLGYFISLSRIAVRKSSYTRMIENLLAVLTSFKHADHKKKSEERLIWRLNLKITGCIFNGERYGWVFFFSQVDDLKQISRLDSFVKKELSERGLSHLGR